LQSAVISITQIHAGSAYNVIPDTAHLAGTVRTFDDETRNLIRARIRDIAAGMATAFTAEIDVDLRDVFTVLDNSPEGTDAVRQAATSLFGEAALDRADTRRMASEDFADMLRVVPGAYCWLGMAHGPPLHSPNYRFDDEIIPLGAALLARLVEQQAAPRGS
jgi:amidohydrolase